MVSLKRGIQPIHEEQYDLIDLPWLVSVQIWSISQISLTPHQNAPSRIFGYKTHQALVPCWPFRSSPCQIFSQVSDKPSDWLQLGNCVRIDSNYIIFFPSLFVPANNKTILEDYNIFKTLSKVREDQDLVCLKHSSLFFWFTAQIHGFVWNKRKTLDHVDVFPRHLLPHFPQTNNFICVSI